jgi:hypothetical protein
MRHVIWFTVGLAIAAPAAAEDISYLCVTEAAAGIAFDQAHKRWVGTMFNTANRKFIFRRTRPDDTYAPHDPWRFYSFGRNGNHDIPDAMCSKDFEADTGSIYCTGIFGEFIFNKKTLRFQHYYWGMYVHPNPEFGEGADTPTIHVGTCSPL